MAVSLLLVAFVCNAALALIEESLYGHEKELAAVPAPLAVVFRLRRYVSIGVPVGALSLGVSAVVRAVLRLSRRNTRGARALLEDEPLSLTTMWQDLREAVTETAIPFLRRAAVGSAKGLVRFMKAALTSPSTLMLFLLYMTCLAWQRLVVVPVAWLWGTRALPWPLWVVPGLVRLVLLLIWWAAVSVAALGAADEAWRSVYVNWRPDGEPSRSVADLPEFGNPFDILALPRGACRHEAAAAGRREMFKYHPDKRRGLKGEAAAFAATRYRAAVAAHKLLSEPEARETYDAAVTRDVQRSKHILGIDASTRAYELALVEWVRVAPASLVLVPAMRLWRLCCSLRRAGLAWAAYCWRSCTALCFAFWAIIRRKRLERSSTGCLALPPLTSSHPSSSRSHLQTLRCLHSCWSLHFTQPRCYWPQAWASRFLRRRRAAHTPLGDSRRCR